MLQLAPFWRHDINNQLSILKTKALILLMPNSGRPHGADAEATVCRFTLGIVVG